MTLEKDQSYQFCTRSWPVTNTRTYLVGDPQKINALSDEQTAKVISGDELRLDSVEDDCGVNSGLVFSRLDDQATISTRYVAKGGFLKKFFHDTYSDGLTPQQLTKLGLTEKKDARALGV